MAAKRKKAKAKAKAPLANQRADQSNWRTKMQAARIKFTDKQKERYLESLRINGLMGRAASTACTTAATVIAHREADPDFDEGVEKALETFRDIVANAVHERGVKGWDEPVFNKGMRVIEPMLGPDGEQLLTAEGKERFQYAAVRKFSDNLLILDAKRVDPTYRDKTAIDINNGDGGVLLVGPGMTPEEAIIEGEKANIEADRLHAEREAAKLTKV